MEESRQPLTNSLCSMTHPSGDDVLPCLNDAAHFARVIVNGDVRTIGYCKSHLGALVLQWYTMESRPSGLEAVVDDVRSRGD